MKKSTHTNPITPFPQDEVGPDMKGCDIVVKCLEREGVDTVFAYPGGASMELHQALVRSKTIRTILPRQEQGGGFMAHGYSRATGKPGVAMATSGPGATNMVTCIADAFMDSIPLIVITGQVFQHLIGKSAFQETDFLGMTLPIVKHSYLVLDVNDLPRIIKEAFFIATNGRPGPVVIDIPKDVQQKIIKPVFPSKIHLPGYKEIPHAADAPLLETLRMIETSERPVLYTGGGIISADAVAELREFAEITGIPVASTLMGIGAFDPLHEQGLYWFGMHGTVAGNWAVCDSDILIALGARFDDRITGAVAKFAPHAKIIHIDIDASEHNKNKVVHLPILSDVKYALRRMIELAKERNFSKPNISKWMATIRQWKQEHPYPFHFKPHDTYILQQETVQTIFEETNGEAIVSVGVGQHQMWAPQYYHFKHPRTYLSSLGLGTMGFGLPAAIGAKVACPDKTVIDIDGDGSFMMNIQELATAKVEKIPVKIVILNNQHLGMVMQWEDRFYEGVRGHTILGDPNNIGGPDNLSALYPDFVTICAGFGIKARCVTKKEDLRPAIQEMLACKDEPFLLDVICPYSEHVLPFIPQNKSAKEILTD